MGMENNFKEALRFSEERYRDLFENVNDLIQCIDGTGHFIYVNNAWLNALGYKEEEVPDLKFFDILHPNCVDHCSTMLNCIMSGGDVQTVDIIFVTKDGREIKVEGNINSHWDNGKFISTRAIFRDVTERKLFEEALMESEQRYKRLVEFSPDGLAVHHEGNLVFVNPSLLKMVGAASLEEVLGKPVLDFIHKDYKQVVEGRMIQALEQEKPGALLEEKLIKIDNSTIDVEIASTPIIYQGEKAVLVVVRDISERKKAESLIHKLAYHDTLTGLPNRRFFNEHFSYALAEASQKNKLTALMFIDLDELKNVNDSLGHAAGDELIKAFAARLKGLVRNDDIFSRWGGDEFTLVITELSDESFVVNTAERILEAFEQPFNIKGHDLYVTPSIGITIYPLDGIDQESIIKNADTAMYRAKELGGNNYQFYTREMNEKVLQNITLANSLRQALSNGEFEIFYQPIVNVDTAQIVGTEALLRWNNPQMGLVLPGEFIPIAEKTGLIIPIGEWVIRNACLQNKQWQEAGFPTIYVSINLSARQFRQPNLVEIISSIIKETRIDPRWLRLEITESTAVKNVEFTIKTLQELKYLGIKIAIDDFGTGYSSLNYLKRFPLHTLKIDRAFVQDITNTPEDGAIASAIITLAQSLKLETIAEGVETIEQLNILRSKQCSKIQGYLFCRPLPALDIKNLFLKNENYLAILQAAAAKEC